MARSVSNTVRMALRSTAKQETVIVREDTDLLVLLNCHARNVRHNIFFRPETKRLSQKRKRCWSIPAMRALIRSVVTNNILFLLAILWCDTTSGVYGLENKL